MEWGFFGALKLGQASKIAEEGQYRVLLVDLFQAGPKEAMQGGHKEKSAAAWLEATVSRVGHKKKDHNHGILVSLGWLVCGQDF